MQDLCVYCSGSGYFQLITGGSETCPSCLGTGKKEESQKQPVPNSDR